MLSGGRSAAGEGHRCPGQALDNLGEIVTTQRYPVGRVMPNRSLSRTGVLVAAGACLSALIPGTLLCLLLGAWPMFPFLGLEIAVVIGAFAWLDPVAAMFQSAGRGQIVGISSVAGDRGRALRRSRRRRSSGGAKLDGVSRGADLHLAPAPLRDPQAPCSNGTRPVSLPDMRW